MDRDRGLLGPNEDPTSWTTRDGIAVVKTDPVVSGSPRDQPAMTLIQLDATRAVRVVTGRVHDPSIRADGNAPTVIRAMTKVTPGCSMTAARTSAGWSSWHEGNHRTVSSGTRWLRAPNVQLCF